MHDLLACGHTRRYHTHQTIGHQTVAEHSARVGLLVMQLCNGKPSANLLMAALTHDLGECETGDTPAPVKWQNPAIDRELGRLEGAFLVRHGLDFVLSSHEAQILKFADTLECGFYAVDQMMLGNRNMAYVVDIVLTKLTDSAVMMISPAQQLVELLREKYHGAS